MKSEIWQATILTNFSHKNEPMLLVIDPDHLLRGDTLLSENQNRSYDVLELQVEVEFRSRFERDYRGRWDAGEARHLDSFQPYDPMSGNENPTTLTT